MRVILIMLLLTGFVGCATYYDLQLDNQYGSADPARFDQSPPAQAEINFTRDIKPILDSRCVVCHGCYDSPCQLNLAAYEGATRGAHKDLVYNSERLIAAEPTRLFTDALTMSAWREKGFYPVLNERAPTVAANREGSVMYRMLALKSQHGMPASAVLPDEDFDFSLNRAQQCPTIEEMNRFEKKFPHWGMPYGLPALSEREHNLLSRWIEAGAPYNAAAALPPGYTARIAEWEQFLNGDSLKSQLMSRYIYEHWFYAHLYFDDMPGNEYFELVRSVTPPGEPINLIASRRPYDDPGVTRVYYRLQPIQRTVLSKTHLPYALNAKRMARIKSWFLDASYPVTSLPSYLPEQASNPFITFHELPITARYRFMLDEAQFSFANFVKGPVCRGQLALNVINDHFWVVFIDPTFEETLHSAEFMSQGLENLQLPAEQESTARLLAFRSYSDLEANYLRSKSEFLNRFGERHPIQLNMLWQGEGSNPNAALTVFRHFDSASVVQGLIGEQPQTVLVFGYPLLERMHYLLVSGYDVFGNAGHQLATRLYMDFLRMESELNFLGFLPRDQRQRIHDHWYRDVDPSHIEHFSNVATYYDQETGIQFQTNNPLAEMYSMMKQYYAPLSQPVYDLAASKLPAAAQEKLRPLSEVYGQAATVMPESAFLSIEDANGRFYHFTLLRQSAHLNVAMLLGEEKRRVPAEDRLLVVNGFVGAYPNTFYKVALGELPQFVQAVQDLKAEADYQLLMTRFGIRRTDARFWAHSDALHAAHREWAPREAGLFDYSRIENR